MRGVRRAALRSEEGRSGAWCARRRGGARLRRRRLRVPAGRSRARGGVGRGRGDRCRCIGSAPTTCRGSRPTARCWSVAPTTSRPRAGWPRPGGRSSTPTSPAATCRARRRASERSRPGWRPSPGPAPGGSAIVQASPNDPAVQALVQGNPRRFHGDEARRRAEAGFPVGAAVFRVAGAPGSRLSWTGPRARSRCSSRDRGADGMLARARPRLACPEFGRAIRELAARDVVTRVEAEPHL